MSEHHPSLPTSPLPFPVIIWACFIAMVAIFWGYAFLLREKALSEEELLRSELRELREEHRQLLDQQEPAKDACDCQRSAVQVTPTPQPDDSRRELNKQHSFIYTVEKGDNVWTIAAHYRVQPEALMRWNDLTPRSRIFPGDELTIILEEEKELEHRENSPDHVQPGSGDRPAGSTYQVLDQPDETLR